METLFVPLDLCKKSNGQCFAPESASNAMSIFLTIRMNKLLKSSFSLLVIRDVMNLMWRRWKYKMMAGLMLTFRSYKHNFANILRPLMLT